MEENERSARWFVCAADESSGDEPDNVASLPKEQGQVRVREQEGSEEASFHTRKGLQQGEKGAEPEQMEWAKEPR